MGIYKLARCNNQFHTSQTESSQNVQTTPEISMGSVKYSAQKGEEGDSINVEQMASNNHGDVHEMPTKHQDSAGFYSDGVESTELSTERTSSGSRRMSLVSTVVEMAKSGAYEALFSADTTFLNAVRTELLEMCETVLNFTKQPAGPNTDTDCIIIIVLPNIIMYTWISLL